LEENKDGLPNDEAHQMAEGGEPEIKEDFEGGSDEENGAEDEDNANPPASGAPQISSQPNEIPQEPYESGVNGQNMRPAMLG